MLTENTASFNELSQCIENAMSKVQSKKESDLCRYLPAEEGYIHHFAFAKLKKTNPDGLRKMIEENIIKTENPSPVAPKPRQRLNEKKSDGVLLKPAQINQILRVLKQAKPELEGAEDLIVLLSPKQKISDVQKLLIKMVREKAIDQSLWNSYVTLIQEEQKA